MNDWIEDSVREIKDNPNRTKMICTELWRDAYAIGAARQKTITEGNIVEYIPLRFALKVIDEETARWGCNIQQTQAIRNRFLALKEGE